ncbi:MAG TPA: hypothetical protein VHG28_01925 [Longimicrobiaceae bacterium]|nr:hypothetical protein [Longimicrobiaceae bacterium]
MSSLLGAVGLLLLSLFMLLGFLRSGADVGAPATLAALLVTVALPAAGGAALLVRHFGRGKRLSERRERLRLQTMESEVLRLAGRHGGRLALVEVVAEMAVTPETAKEVLDSLVSRELADLEVTESGVLVYSFHDVRHLGEKPHARGILDA